MNVKAQALLNGAKCVREKFGEAALEDVLAACDPAVRERCSTAIAINWHPQRELTEFLTVADAKLGKGDGKLSEEIGAIGARANLRHLALRLAFFLARPEFLMRRVAGVWRQYNDEGDMVVREFSRGRMLAELADVSEPDWVLCCSITGWLHEAGVATGMRRLYTTHTECRGRGMRRCIWELRWSERESL